MKNFIKKYRFAVISFILFIAVIVFFVVNKETVSPVPTPVPTKFELVNVSPPPGKQEIVLSNLSIHFTFSDSVDLSNTVVTIKPNIDFVIDKDQSGKTIIVIVNEDWTFNTEYNITVETKAENGQALETPVKYSFTPTQMTVSDLEEIPVSE